MQRSTLIVFALLLLLIGGGVATYLVLSQRTVQPLSTGEDLRGQALFTDGEYGFSMHYPEEMLTDYTFASFYHLPASWRVNTLPEGTGTPVIAVVGYRIRSENSYPRYFDAEVRVGTSVDPKEVERCDQPALEQGEVVLPDTVIHGTTFKTFSFESAGMMQYVKGVSYRTVHNGACFAIEQLQTGSSYRDDPKSSSDVADEVLQAKFKALDAVVKTFTFVQP